MASLIDKLRRVKAQQIAREIFELRTRAEETKRDFSALIAPLRAELARLVAYSQQSADLSRGMVAVTDRKSDTVNL